MQVNIGFYKNEITFFLYTKEISKESLKLLL